MPAVIEPESLYAGDSWSRSFEIRRPTIAAGRPGGPVSPGSFAGSIAPTEWSA